MAKKVESNEVILKEILVRVPVKPLLQFKTVSKRWLAIISSPRFCHSHTLRQYKHSSRPFPSALLLDSYVLRPSPLKCPIYLKNNSSDSSNFRYVKVPRMNITIMQSCNGLLLLEGTPLKTQHESLEAKHYVYNPTTNQVVTVNYPTGHFCSSDVSLFLCFEPLKSPHYKIVAIWFRDHSSQNDIKNHFARSVSLNLDSNYVATVYSSETKCWSDPGVNCKASVPFEAVYCNGAIFCWRLNAEYSKYFDIENQCFKKFPMPIGFGENKRERYYGESGGRFHFVLQSILDFEIDILELSEDRRSWSLKFHLKPDSMLADSMIICIVRQGIDDVDSMLVFSIIGKFLVACNLLDCSIKKLNNFSPCLMTTGFQYYENLSAVDPSVELENTSSS